MSLAFEMKTVCLWKKVIHKVMTTNCAKMRILKNGGTTTQSGTLRELLNILSISLLSRVHATSGYSRCKKSSNVILRFKEN